MKLTNNSVNFQSASASFMKNKDTAEKNDYIIMVKIKYSGYDLLDEYVYEEYTDHTNVLLNIDNKTYETIER